VWRRVGPAAQCAPAATSSSTGGVVVIFTVDPAMFARFWLLDDYPPALGDTDAKALGFFDRLIHLLDEPRVVRVLVPHDCREGLGAAYWRRPHLPRSNRPRGYLDVGADTRREAAQWARPTRIRPRLRRMGHKYADLPDRAELDVGYRLVVADVTEQLALADYGAAQCGCLTR
jgi:hypothetical protein